MKKQTSLALAAALLLAGVSVASAASTTSNASTPAKPTVSAMAKSNAMAKPAASTLKTASARDKLELSTTQRSAAWNDISKSASKQMPPKGFDARVGVAIPSSIKTQPVPSKAASAVPSLKPYDFAMLQKRLLIVNPSDHKVAEVITR